MRTSRRSPAWWVAGGAAAGLAVWIYDYDFFLNAGGPATPISMAILRASGLQNANVLVFLLWPPAVLIGVGAGLGFALSKMLRRNRAS